MATGALERPIAFANNDRPNIMLASAVRGLIGRYGVVPGSTGVVFTNNDDAYLTAFALKKVGVNVRVVDSRSRSDGALVKRAIADGIDVQLGSVIGAVEGTLGVTAVKIAAYRKGQGRVITEKRVECDFIAMSGGWNPALHIWCHNGGKIQFDDALQSFRPKSHTDNIVAVGAANGSMSVAATLAEAQTFGKKATRFKVEEPERGALADALALRRELTRIFENIVGEQPVGVKVVA